MRVSRRADASWRLGLNHCIMLGSRLAGDLTEKRLRDRTRRWSSTQDRRREGVKPLGAGPSPQGRKHVYHFSQVNST